jgi:hypothetical protein
MDGTSPAVVLRDLVLGNWRPTMHTTEDAALVTLLDIDLGVGPLWLSLDVHAFELPCAHRALPGGGDAGGWVGP